LTETTPVSSVTRTVNQLSAMSSQWRHTCLHHNDITPVWHYAAYVHRTIVTRDRTEISYSLIFIPSTNSLITKWKTKLISASSPISKAFNKTTALSVSETQRCALAAGQISNLSIIHAWPAVVRSDHRVLVVSLDVVCLHELVQATLGVFECPVSMQVSSEVCFFSLQQTETSAAKRDDITGHHTQHMHSDV